MNVAGPNGFAEFKRRRPSAAVKIDKLKRFVERHSSVLEWEQLGGPSTRLVKLCSGTSQTASLPRSSTTTTSKTLYPCDRCSTVCISKRQLGEHQQGKNCREKQQQQQQQQQSVCWFGRGCNRPCNRQHPEGRSIDEIAQASRRSQKSCKWGYDCGSTSVRVCTSEGPHAGHTLPRRTELHEASRRIWPRWMSFWT